MSRRKPKPTKTQTASKSANTTPDSQRGATSVSEGSAGTQLANKLSQISRRRRWVYRITAAIGVPCVLFLGLELALRICGAGYPTGYYLRKSQSGQTFLIDNPQFGWRYFGQALSRSAGAKSILAVKPKDTVRIIVFGESAAFGDPHPDFGLARVLSALLTLRHPGRDFEVINAAMTSINSHVIRDIAKDSIDAGGDIWVTYIGNNEVVGPFGSGTVFGSKSPPRPIVRATIALKATRVGQSLDALLGRFQNRSSEELQWGGLMMFADNHVSRDDSSMDRVYSSFRANLHDIIAMGQRSGAGLVVSTVAVNLRDCAPFGSAHSVDLSHERRAEWETLFERAVALQQSQDHDESLALFRQAAEIDDGYAEVHYRWAETLVALGRPMEALDRYQIARDLDTIRLRCDGKLNEITREVASGRESERIRFVDAAKTLNVGARDGIAGSDLFYEHVHLTFEANYRLAIPIATEIESLIDSPSDAMFERPWPTFDECAQRLAWADWIELLALSDILARVHDPPFTTQSNNAEQIDELRRKLHNLSGATSPQALRLAVERCKHALALNPNDHAIYGRLAKLLANLGDLSGALDAAGHVVQQLPNNAESHYQLGLILAKMRRDHQALAEFQVAQECNPYQAQILVDIAKTQFRLDRVGDGINSLKRAIELKPHFGTAYFTLGAAYEDQGRRNEAEEMYRQAVRNPPEQTGDLVHLAQTCQTRGWYEEGLAMYRKAIAQSADDGSLHLSAAICLANLGNWSEADTHYRRVLALAPAAPEPRVYWAVQMAQLQRHADAVVQFRDALRLEPELHNARIGLGISLLALERNAEALQEFQEVVRRDPTNEIARNYVSNIIESQVPRSSGAKNGQRP